MLRGKMVYNGKERTAYGNNVLFGLCFVSQTEDLCLGYIFY